MTSIIEVQEKAGIHVYNQLTRPSRNLFQKCRIIRIHFTVNGTLSMKDLQSAVAEAATEVLAELTSFAATALFE